MHGWIEPFFERASAAVEAGHIWSAQPIHLPPRHGLKIERVDAKDDAKLDFKVVERGDATFGHPPIHSLGLASDEAVVLAKATRERSVVVLNSAAASAHLADDDTDDDEDAAADADADADAAGYADAAIVMVLPLYAAAPLDDATRRAVANYAYANAFYLPASARPRFEESVARLDQVQPLRRGELAQHRGLKLSSDALDALVEWFVAFTTNRLLDDSLILAYRREQLAGDS